MAKPPKTPARKAKKNARALQNAQAMQPVDPAPETKRPARAYGRSLSDFEPLLPAEKILRTACRMGMVAVISDTRPEQATKDITVRAGFLRFMLLGGDADAPLHEHGVRLKGSWIEGELNLENTPAASAIDCQSSVFTHPLILQRSILPGGIFLQNSKIYGIWAEELSTVSVILSREFNSDGEIRLLNAKLDGSLSCSGSTLYGRNGKALSVDGAYIKGSVLLNNGFQSIGEVSFTGAEIGGILSCSKGSFNGINSSPLSFGDALSFNSAIIGGNAFLNNGFSSRGSVQLKGARIRGDLECSRGSFDNPDIDALTFDDTVIQGNVLLDDGFLSTGSVCLNRARINGSLICQYGRCIRPKASIGAVLSYHLSHAGPLPKVDHRIAFCATGAVIGGDIDMRGFDIHEKLVLSGTQVGGDLIFDLINFEKTAIFFLDGIKINGSFFIRDLAKPINNISLSSASIGQLVDDSISWGQNLVLNGFTYTMIYGDAYTFASTRLAWLDKQRPEMSGLYAPGTIEFCPQPWRQLQKVLREMGHTEDARQVAIAFEDRLRKADLIGASPENWWRWRKWLYRHTARGFHYGFRVLTGYGYRPIRLLGWFASVWLACATFYWFAALPPRSVFAPSDPLMFQNETYAACVPGSKAAKAEQAKPVGAAPAPVKGAGNWYLCEKLREEYTGFSPMAYSLDVLMPLVDLQQQKDWAPMIPTPKALWWDELRGSGWKHITRMVVWAETLFGWLASLLLVAIVSGLTKRRED